MYNSRRSNFSRSNSKTIAFSLFQRIIIFACHILFRRSSTDPTAVRICTRFYSLLRSRFGFVSANGNNTPPPFVSLLINSATGWLPCFRLDIKSRVLLPPGLLCVARTRVPSRSGRQSVRRGERIGEHMNGDSCPTIVRRLAEGRRTVVNVAPFTFP